LGALSFFAGKDEVDTMARGCGWMTLPTTGSWGAAGTETGAETVADGGCCDGDALDEEDGVEGVADDGRDQPGPVVVDNTGAAVSLAVTSRE